MDVEVDDVVFDDEFVVGVLEEQRLFDDNDEIDVQQLQRQPKTQYNQHQSLSIICIEAHTDIDLKRVMLPSSLFALGAQARV